MSEMLDEINEAITDVRCAKALLDRVPEPERTALASAIESSERALTGVLAAWGAMPSTANPEKFPKNSSKSD